MEFSIKEEKVKITRKVERPRTITLTLTEVEAGILAAVTGKIAGDDDFTRQTTDAIYFACKEFAKGKCREYQNRITGILDIIR